MAAQAMEAYVPPRSAGNPTPHPKSMPPPPHDSPPRPVPPDDEPRLIVPHSSIEREFDEWEVRNGVGVIRVPEQESGHVKTEFINTWLRTDQGKALPTSTRELIRELLDIAGPGHHRYTTDRRQCVAVIWAGQRNIAERLGLTVAGVRSRMRNAAKFGLINRTKRPFGRSSLTVVELTLPAPVELAPIDTAPNTDQSGCSDSRRALKLQRTVRGSRNGQCVEVAPHLSDAGSNRSAETNQNNRHTDESAKGLSPSSGSKDTDTDATDEPTFEQKGKVRALLIQLGVSPKAAVRMQASTEHRILAAIVTVVAILKQQRPTADFLKSPAARGAWIGSIVFKGKPFGAWIRKELEGNNRADPAIDVLDDAGMIAEQEYPD